MALYGPGGFYENSPVGGSHHFVTGPHVHAVFGKLLARGLLKMRDAMGESDPPTIVEIGAGDGTLAAQLLEYIPGARYQAVERSPGARRRLSDRGIPNVGDLSELDPQRNTIVIANELLDNMPFRRVRMTDGELVELLVDLDGDLFVEKEAPCSPEAEEAAPYLEEGEEAAVSLAALSLVGGLARVLERGYALFIDYQRVPREPRGGVHGYRDQGVVEDFLADPGSADITVGVDLEALGVKAAKEGLQSFEVLSQRRALLALGFGRWMDEQREIQGHLLSQGAGREATRTWSDRNAAQLLVDPAGLGSLRWMVLATPGLARPYWC